MKTVGLFRKIAGPSLAIDCLHELVLAKIEDRRNSNSKKARF
jgi:hypothetical protein